MSDHLRDGDGASDPHQEQVLEQSEPIAIVGIGCRLPGNASSPEKLWDLLSENRSGHGSVPKSRYNAAAFYHPDHDRPGSINSASGYFIDEDIRSFDNAFFGISNIEAVSMDPQQRKLLEVVYECFESAGATLESLSGANVGCYVGNFALDFPLMQIADTENINRYTAAGATPTLLANRISHVFNLKGPSFVLDTGCSSSLYGLHCACSALDLKECDAAVVASANLIQLPQQQILASKTGIISSSATCRTFDAAADGYGRAEGVGAVYLKRLGDALRNRDPIRAVIRGTAINSNGRTPGVMQPSSDGQERVMKKAYARAGLSVLDTDYVEAHGTGTAVGDPTEIEAIARVFSQKPEPVLVGSVKTNIGHSEATSGLSSVIKIVLAMENRIIPATINIVNLNPQVAKHSQNVKIVQRQTPWPKTSCSRASVNSFGFGGANSHAIIEAFKPSEDPSSLLVDCMNRETQSEERLVLLPITANNNVSLDRRVKDLVSMTSKTLLSDIGSIAHTLSVRCALFDFRAFVVARATSDLSKLEIAYASAPQAISATPPLSFVFTGQGAQWNKMGCRLFQQLKVFRKSIRELSAYLPSHNVQGSWTPSELLSREELWETRFDINQPENSQVLCTAIQIGLVDLLRSWGIHPKKVVGHSSGEIAAAYAAGYITRGDAILLAYYRGIAVWENRIAGDTLSPEGAMMAVGINAPEAQHQINVLGFAEVVEIACVNSPNSVTLSGDTAPINSIKERMDSLNIFSRILKTGGIAYHSHHMRNGVGEKYQQLIENHLWISKASPLGISQATMISSVTGQSLAKQDACRSEYWRRNLERSVLFSDAVAQLFTDGDATLIEIGPHPALQVPVKEIRATMTDQSSSVVGHYLPTLCRNKNEVISIMSLAGNLFSHGYKLDFDALNQVAKDEQQVFVSLPTYSWDYSNTVPWKEPRPSMELRNRRHGPHELLGSMMTGGSENCLIWRNTISSHDVPWLRDHKFGSTVLFPAAGFIAMAVAAVCQTDDFLSMNDDPNVSIRQIKLFNALPMPENDSTIELLTELKRSPISATVESSSWWDFRISSLLNGQQASHVSGNIACLSSSEIQSMPDDTSSASSLEPQDVGIWYKKLSKIGLFAGPTFQVIQDLRVDRMRRREVAQATIAWNRGLFNNETEEYEYSIHPTTIDGLLQIGFYSAWVGSHVGDIQCVVPTSIESIDLNISAMKRCSIGALLEIQSHAAKTGFASVVAHSELYSPDNHVLVRIHRARATAYQGAVSGSQDNNEQRMPCLRVHWRPDFTMLDSTSCESWFSQHRGQTSAQQFTESAAENFMADCLDLIVHKKPNERILFLNISDRDLGRYLDVLGARRSYRRFATVRCVIMNSDGGLSDVTASMIDDELIVDNSVSLEFSEIGVLVADLKDAPELVPRLGDLLHPGTDLLLNVTTESVADVQVWKRHLAFATNRTSPDVVIVARSVHPTLSGSGSGPIFVIGHDIESRLNVEVMKAFRSIYNDDVSFLAFENVTELTIPPECRIVLTLESEATLLEKLTPEDLKRLQVLTSTARSLLWVTRGSLLHADQPAMSLAWGAARAIRLEEPQLQLALFDYDGISGDSITAGNIVRSYQEAFFGMLQEREFLESHGILHVSRWDTDEALNNTFRSKLAREPSLCRVDAAGDFQLTIGAPGQLDTLHFERQTQRQQELSGEDVEVEAKSYGLNAKDLYSLSDKFDSKKHYCSQEFAGVVRRIGPEVKSLRPGDRIVAVVAGKFRNIDVVPEFACAKLLPSEDFESASTIPLVFTTALYSLKYLGRLQPGESILIHSACGGVGLAAIQIATWLGATIFATAGTQEKREWLSQHCGIPLTHIYSSRDTQFLTQILGATEHRGVDVVLNSLTGELLHASFEACAPLGRFIEIGKKDIMDSGKLNMATFSRSVSFASFDLFELTETGNKRGHQTWRRLLEETFQLFREGVLQPIEPREAFDISEIVQSFRFFSQPARKGKVALKMDNPNSMIKLRPERFDSKFSSTKTYLMVGGFGGIGASITKWMYSLGARSFIFLSRSGDSKQSAADLVTDLRLSGCEVKVVAGDVSRMDDVRRAFECCPSRIGGIVHASMSVRAVHWASLNCQDWLYGIGSKVQGTQNLHEALSIYDHEEILDFFLLISSISGTIGSVTEPGYCAANAYQDNFARFRRAQHRNAVSLAFGVVTEVGYLHEHPQMEAVYRRRGLQAVDEGELLHLVDLAITHSDNDDYPYDLAGAHLLTGLEMQVAKAQAMDPSSMAFDILFQDPRAALLKGAYNRDMKNASTAASLSKTELPQQIRDAVLEGTALHDAVSNAMATKFSNIMMMSTGQLRYDQPLSSLGIDSMLAAEFRTFIFQALQVDIPFTSLLSKSATFGSIVTAVVDQLAMLKLRNLAQRSDGHDS
ncbi:putative polyketide synthase [Nemania sp. FL0916]|nr:putative polyketide synthase [Nemania sp. FL0916]